MKLLKKIALALIFTSASLLGETIVLQYSKVDGILELAKGEEKATAFLNKNRPILFINAQHIIALKKQL